MLISPAYAQAAGGAGGGFEAFIPLILIFVVFYFLMIRPQQKRAKEHKAMLEALRRGDKVITNGGVYGKITKVENDTDVSLEIAKDIVIRVRRDMIFTLVDKTEPAKGEKNEDGAQEDASSEEKPKEEGGLKKLFGGKK